MIGLGFLYVIRRNKKQEAAAANNNAANGFPGPAPGQSPPPMGVNPMGTPPPMGSKPEGAGHFDPRYSVVSSINPQMTGQTFHGQLSPTAGVYGPQGQPQYPQQHMQQQPTGSSIGTQHQPSGGIYGTSPVQGQTTGTEPLSTVSEVPAQNPMGTGNNRAELE